MRDMPLRMSLPLFSFASVISSVPVFFPFTPLYEAKQEAAPPPCHIDFLDVRLRCYFIAI